MTTDLEDAAMKTINEMNSQQRRKAGLPSQRKLSLLSGRMETTSCDKCHAVIGHMMPYVVCRMPGGKFEGRCKACYALDGAKCVITGFCAVPGPDGDPWSRDDRAWFAANPQRRWRLRWPLRGEMEHMPLMGIPVPAPDGRQFDPVEFFAGVKRDNLKVAVAIFQIEEGVRARHIVAVGDDPLDSYTEAGIERLTPGANVSTKFTAQQQFGEKRTAVLNIYADVAKEMQTPESPAGPEKQSQCARRSWRGPAGGSPARVRQ